MMKTLKTKNTKTHLIRAKTVAPTSPLHDAPQNETLLDDDWDGLDDSVLAKGTAFASEGTLRQLWDTPEEDEAWRDL